MSTADKKEAGAGGSYRAREKWGSIIDQGFTGFQILPDVLVRNQHSLEIDNGEMVVLLNILMHWWQKDQLPHPRTDTIARRMGVSTRTVERHMKRLEAKKLISRQKPSKNGDGPLIRKIDLSGLLERLEAYAEGMRHYEESVLIPRARAEARATAS